MTRLLRPSRSCERAPARCLAQSTQRLRRWQEAEGGGCSIPLVGGLGWSVKDTVPEEGQPVGGGSTFEGMEKWSVAAGASEHRDAGGEPVAVNQVAIEGQDVGCAERLHRQALDGRERRDAQPGRQVAIGLFLENLDH